MDILGCCSRTFSTTNDLGTAEDDEAVCSSSARNLMALLIFDHIVCFVLEASMFIVTEQQRGAPVCVKLSSGPKREDDGCPRRMEVTDFVLALLECRGQGNKYLSNSKPSSTSKVAKQTRK